MIIIIVLSAAVNMVTNQINHLNFMGHSSFFLSILLHVESPLKEILYPLSLADLIQTNVIYAIEPLCT